MGVGSSGVPRQAAAGTEEGPESVEFAPEAMPVVSVTPGSSGGSAGDGLDGMAGGAGSLRFPVWGGDRRDAINYEQAGVGLHQFRVDEGRFDVAGKQPQATRRGAAKPHGPAESRDWFGRGKRFTHRAETGHSVESGWASQGSRPVPAASSVAPRASSARSGPERPCLSSVLDFTRRTAVRKPHFC